MAELAGVENLVKRVYSMSEASPVNAALEKQAQTVLSLHGGDLGAYSYGFISLIERMIATLRKMSTLQVASFAEEPVLPALPPEGAEISPLAIRMAPVPEPVNIRLTREPPSIGAVIRRLIRRLRGRREPIEPASPLPLENVEIVEELVVEEDVPWRTSPRSKEPVSIPELNKRVVAKVPPMYTHPAEPEKPERLLIQYPMDTRGEEIVPPKLEKPAPRTTRVSLPEEPWRPTLKVGQVSEMGKLVAVLAAASQAVPPVQLQTSVMESMMEMNATVRNAAVERVDGSGGAVPLKWSPVVIKAIGVPSAVREEPKAPSIGVPEPTHALVGFPKGADTVEPTDSVLEREAESKTAQVASQMSRMSRGVAERVAEIYREGVIEKLPPAERVKGDAIPQVPALDDETTRRLTAMAATLQKAEALQSAQKERAREPSSLPAMLELTMAGAQIAAASREAGTTFSEALRKMTDSVPQLAAAGARAAGQTLPRIRGLTDSKISVDQIKGIGAAVSHAESTLSDSLKNIVVDLKEGKVGDRPLDKVLDRLEDGLLEKVPDGTKKDGLLGSLDGLIGDRVLERAPLEGVPPIPGMSLHEVIPALTRKTVQQPSAPRNVEARPRPSFEKPKPIEVKLETSLDDIDLRELERRLARILKDEARRYGVY